MEIRERRSGVDGGRKFGEGERGRWMKGEKVEVDRKLPLNLLTLGEDEVPGAFEYSVLWWKYYG